MKNLFLTKTRWLVTIILLTALGIGNAWGTLPANPTWTATALADIADGATVIIIGSSNALPSTTTSSNPAKISCTVSTTAGVSTITPASGTLQNLAWTVDKLTSSWKFYQEGSNSVRLYLSSTTSSTALRVGNASSSNDEFVMGSGGKLLKVTTAGRYVGPYSSGSDWRTYNSETAGNYNNASLTFYVLNTGGGCTSPTTALSITNASTATVGVPLSLTTTGGNGGTVTWSVVNGTGSATVDGSTLTPTGAGTVTVTATQGVNDGKCGASPTQTITITRAAATITLSEAGATSSVAGTHYGGDSYTLPSTTSATCGSKVLVGWSTVEVATTDTKPTSNYYEKGASATLAAGSNTFYAVFATASGGGTPTAYTAGDEGDFVIASKVGDTWYALPTNPTVNSGKVTGEEITVNTSGGVDYVTSSNASGYTWTIADATYGQTLSDGSNKIYHSNGGTSGTNLTYGSATDKTWDITYSSPWLTFKGMSSANSNNSRGMLFNGSVFGGYSLNNADESSYYHIRVLPISDGTTYSAYSTSCSSTAKTITIVPVAGGTVTTSPSGSAEAGNTVTITLTPDAHYTVGGAPTVVDANSQSVAVSGSGTSYTFTMPNANVTITPATWNPINVTITWHRKTGNTPQVVQEGKSDLTFPNTTDVDADCAPFLGWIEGTSWTDSQDEPATYYEVGDLVPAVNTNIDYTAIYGERETTETAAYVKVTSAPVDWSGDYLIVREIGGEYYVAFDGSLTTLDVNNNYVNVSASGGAIAATNALAAKKWTIAKIGATSDYSIKSASGYYIGCTGTGNGLNSSTSTVYSNTLSYSTDHTVITSSGGPVLQTYNSSRFRYYASSQGAIQLYKLGTAEMETVTYTKNPACTPKYRITVNSVTGGSPSSDKSLEPAGETITLTANTADGYSFAGWTLTHTEGGAAASVTYTTGSASTETAAFTMPAYDVTVTASFAKKVVSELKVMDGSTVVANTTGSVSGTLNVSTGANKTLDVVITPSDAFDHSWTASVTAGGTYASISNVTSDGFRVNGLSQGDATVTVTAPNDGSAKVVTFTVHVTDVLPSEIILKRDGSETPIDALTMYYDAANSRGQYVKVNVSYTPTPTNKGFTFSSDDATSVSSHAHAQTNPNFYETLNARKVTSSPVNCTFTSAATGSVTKVLAVTVLPCPADRFVDYIHGNATVTRAAQVSADHWSINTSITTPTLSDAPESSSADCEAGHYHLIGWLPQSIAEALFEAGTPITSETEGLVTAGAEIEASGITWYAIWAKKQ